MGDFIVCIIYAAFSTMNFQYYFEIIQEKKFQDIVIAINLIFKNNFSVLRMYLVFKS